MSSNLCTFGTPHGIQKFLRLPYDIKSAPEVFQSRFKEIFIIAGVYTYIDDLLVWRITKQEHDKRLKDFLKLARLNNVKVNLQKCKFGKSEIKYMGHIISANGISSDNNKIKAIKKLPKPNIK